MHTIKPLVIEAIEQERSYQKQKYGSDKQQSLPGYLLVMRKELEEAELAWAKNATEERNTALEEVLQVVATGVACLERYGIRGIAYATDDVAHPDNFKKRTLSDNDKQN